MSAHMPVSHSFDSCGFIVSFQIRKFESSNCVVLCQDCCGSSKLFEDSRMLWSRTEVLEAADLGLNLPLTNIYLEEVWHDS